MPKFDSEYVRKLAELAHLSLSTEECDHFSHELESIVNFAERIQAIDTDGVAPMANAASEEGSTLREDEPREGLRREDVLEGAPDAGEGLFKVPKVLP